MVSRRRIRVFPTCVGMNRQGNEAAKVKYGVPHMRGDEPDRADYVHGYVPNAVLPDVWEDLKLLKKK
jgi:hypothetical protein